MRQLGVKGMGARGVMRYVGKRYIMEASRHCCLVKLHCIPNT